MSHAESNVYEITLYNPKLKCKCLAKETSDLII